MKKIIKFRKEMKGILEYHHKMSLDMWNSNKKFRYIMMVSNLLGWLTIVLAIIYIDFTISKVFLGFMAVHLLFYIGICGIKLTIKHTFLPWFKW